MEVIWAFALATIAAFSVTCSKINLDVNVQEGNFSQVMNFAINSTTEQLLVFLPPQSRNPYKIRAWITSTSIKQPVLVVVKQESNALFWSIPLVLPSKNNTSVSFYNTSRILCDPNLLQTVQTTTRTAQNFSVTLSTSNDANVEVYIEVVEVDVFYLANNQSYIIEVSPSQPRYFFYKFGTSKTGTIIIKIDSWDDVCLTASIQGKHCPVFDLDTDIAQGGVHETINTKGGIRIRRKNYHDGIFVVFVAKVDNYECEQKLKSFLSSTLRMGNNRCSTVQFIVLEDTNDEDYVKAIWIVLLALVFFLVFAIIMVCGIFKYPISCQPHVGNTNSASDSSNDHENVAGSTEQLLHAQSRNENRSASASSNDHGHITASTEQLQNENRDIDDSVVDDNTNTVVQNQREQNVAELCKNFETNDRSSRNYLWHIMNITLFYSIPVVQLVFSYQKVVNKTGNEDVCYYNFLCAQPVWFFSDFNHFFSNIGYVCMGVLFVGVVFHRQRSEPKRTTGIPLHYGVFYAMGAALISEGILSASYHICPNQSNFQFDTSFMYVMAVLCKVKLYQNRHSDITPAAYSTFAVLGSIILLAMIGILTVDDDYTFIFECFVALIYIALCIYLSLKIYFFDLKENCCSSLDTGSVVLTPHRKARLVVLLIANIINYAMLIIGLYFCFTKAIDFGTFLLVLLMGNAVLYTIIYNVMKVIFKEGILTVQAIIYLVLTIAFWTGAAVCYFHGGIQWKVTPAQSRHRNEECIFLHFYDHHDLWHMLSAVALYFNFMFLLYLDDNVINKNRAELSLF